MEIMDFWDNQAKKFGNDSLATSPDKIAFELEIAEILRYLNEGDFVLDMGCGNGVKAGAITSALKCRYKGVDFSDEMIKAAKAAYQELDFSCGDALDPAAFGSEKFDKIITSRCLINLENFNCQKQALTNIFNALKPDGMYICIENTTDALANLNATRSTLSLAPIAMRWHNCYFSEAELLKSAKALGFRLEVINNFASTYYLISRTLNAVLFDADYNSKLNALAAKLPPVGDFSPMKCFVFKKPLY